jgi:hypothetical protein
LASRIDLSVLDNPPLGRSLLAAYGSSSTPEPAKTIHTTRGADRNMTMMEKLLEVEVGADATVTEEIELICTMTGFRRRFLIHHIGEGFFRSVELSFG